MCCCCCFDKSAYPLECPNDWRAQAYTELYDISNQNQARPYDLRCTAREQCFTTDKSSPQKGFPAMTRYQQGVAFPQTAITWLSQNSLII